MSSAAVVTAASEEFCSERYKTAQAAFQSNKK